MPKEYVKRGYVPLVMAIGFLAFYSLPDGIPLLVKLAMMVATQVAVGKVLDRASEASN